MPGSSAPTPLNRNFREYLVRKFTAIGRQARFRVRKIPLCNAVNTLNRIARACHAAIAA